MSVSHFHHHIHKARVCIFILSSVVLLALSIYSFRVPDQAKSALENRWLVQYEPPHKATLADGSWMKNTEKYLLDQFPFREKTLQTYFGLLDMAQVIERNDKVRLEGDVITVIPFGKYEFTPEKNEAYTQCRISTLSMLKQLCDETGSTLIQLFIPFQNEYFDSLYPAQYREDVAGRDDRFRQYKTAVASLGIDVVDVSDVIEAHHDEYLYFNTDNHYTLRGAYYTYQRLLSHLNDSYQDTLHFPKWDDCECYVLPHRSVGTFLRRYGDAGTICSDSVEYIIPSAMPAYERYEDGEPSDVPLLCTELTDYTVFFGGSTGNPVVKTHRPELPKILYLGFSYCNALKYLSVYSFDEVHCLDPRTYQGNISAYIRSQHFDYVVVVRDDIYETNSLNKCTFK